MVIPTKEELVVRVDHLGLVAVGGPAAGHVLGTGSPYCGAEGVIVVR